MGNNEIKEFAKKARKLIVVVLATIAILATMAIVMLIAVLINMENFASPQKKYFDRCIEWEYFWKKDKNGECVIDLAEVMPFDWDYFVVRNLGGENEITVNGVSYSLLQDEAVSFIKDDKVVFSEVWYKDDYTYQYFIKGSVHFRGNCSCVKKEDAKFKAKKNEPGYLILEKIE